jgi:hypothetical protein
VFLQERLACQSELGEPPVGDGAAVERVLGGPGTLVMRGTSSSHQESMLTTLPDRLSPLNTVTTQLDTQVPSTVPEVMSVSLQVSQPWGVLATGWSPGCGSNEAPKTGMESWLPSSGLSPKGKDV